MNPTPTELVVFTRSLRRRRAAVWAVIVVSLGLAGLIRARGLARS
jgi:hypothetical protein